MRVERVVCDTNVLISAAIVPHGNARAVVDIVLRHGRLLMAEAVFVELATRLARPKFERYVTAEMREEYLQLVRLASEWVAISGRVMGVRDPDDDKVIETAIAGRAGALVTGDGDILALRPVGENALVLKLEDALFKDVAILKPSEFLRLAETGKS